jgi:hypothetical protein
MAILEALQNAAASAVERAMVSMEGIVTTAIRTLRKMDI